MVPVADDLVLLELQRLFQGTLLVMAADGKVCNTLRLPTKKHGTTTDTLLTHVSSSTTLYMPVLVIHYNK